MFPLLFVAPYIHHGPPDHVVALGFGIIVASGVVMVIWMLSKAK